MQTIYKPKGIFSSSGARQSAVVDSPQCRGVLVRYGWDDIEPSPGVFDFSQIDRDLVKIHQAGKSWSLAIAGGPSSPTWIYAAPYNAKSMRVAFKGSMVKIPKFWDAALQTRLAVLADAVAAKYGTDTALSLIYVPQMSANGIEGHFNGTSDLELTSQGLTEDRWVSSVMQAAQAFAGAFPDKAIAVELHYILGTASAPQRIMDAIEDDPDLLNQIGVAIWWLSGKTSYQPDLLTAFAAFSGGIYAQMIGKSADSWRFLNNDFTTAIAQATQIGCGYIEPWESDIKSGAWVDLFDAFNAANP